jgi:hypothetical protein
LAVADGSTLGITDEKRRLKEHQKDIGGFRAFCPDCGTRLFSYAPDKNVYSSIALSTVDTPVQYKPVAHANTESKASWCKPYEDIPQFSGFPDGL